MFHFMCLLLWRSSLVRDKNLTPLKCIHCVEIAVSTQWFIFSTHFHHCVEKAKCTFSQRRSHFCSHPQLLKNCDGVRKAGGLGSTKKKKDDAPERCYPWTGPLGCCLWQSCGQKQPYKPISAKICVCVFKTWLCSWFPSLFPSSSITSSIYT